MVLIAEFHCICFLSLFGITCPDNTSNRLTEAFQIITMPVCFGFFLAVWGIIREVYLILVVLATTLKRVA